MDEEVKHWARGVGMASGGCDEEIEVLLWIFPAYLSAMVSVYPATLIPLASRAHQGEFFLLFWVG